MYRICILAKMSNQIYLSDFLIQFLLSFDFNKDVVEKIQSSNSNFSRSAISALTLRVARLYEQTAIFKSLVDAYQQTIVVDL